MIISWALNSKWIPNHIHFSIWPRCSKFLVEWLDYNEATMTRWTPTSRNYSSKITSFNFVFSDDRFCCLLQKLNLPIANDCTPVGSDVSCRSRLSPPVTLEDPYAPLTTLVICSYLRIGDLLETLLIIYGIERANKPFFPAIIMLQWLFLKI